MVIGKQQGCGTSWGQGWHCYLKFEWPFLMPRQREKKDMIHWE